MYIDEVKQKVLHFWFESNNEGNWFSNNQAFDLEIEQHFGELNHYRLKSVGWVTAKAVG